MAEISLDTERVVFYRELGLALAAWASVERELFLLLKSCFLGSALPGLGRGYMALPGFNTKHLFVDGVVKRWTLDARPNYQGWKSLSDDLRKNSLRRNEVAHNYIQEFPQAPVGQRVASCPWVFPKTWDRVKPHAECLTTLHILGVRMQFVVLGRRVENFRQTLHGGKPLHTGTALQVRRPPTFKLLVKDTFKEMGPPPISAREKRLALDAANAAASLDRSDPT